VAPGGIFGGSRFSVTLFATDQKMRQAGPVASGRAFAKEPAPAEKRSAPIARQLVSLPPSHRPRALFCHGFCFYKPPLPVFFTKSSPLPAIPAFAHRRKNPRQNKAPPGGTHPNRPSFIHHLPSSCD